MVASVCTKEILNRMVAAVIIETSGAGHRFRFSMAIVHRTANLSDNFAKQVLFKVFTCVVPAIINKQSLLSSCGVSSFYATSLQAKHTCCTSRSGQPKLRTRPPLLQAATQRRTSLCMCTCITPQTACQFKTRVGPVGDVALLGL